MRQQPQRRPLFRFLLILCLLVVLFYSAYQIITIQGRYQAEASLHSDLLSFKPTDTPVTDPPLPDASARPASSPRPVFHPEIAALRALNSDVVGWITVEGTAIDYPFVKDPDNTFYLHRDIYKNEAYAGTVFMDYRCEADFSSFNTILYGHHMKNGSMFHDLSLFAEDDFFAAHRTGTILLEDKDYRLEVFACLVIRPDDPMIYRASGWENVPQADYLAYVQRLAVSFRDPGLVLGDRVVTLSTCAYVFEGARTVVLARLVED
ncbi:MAG: class B sortase [Oscillospiraceae bacterium]|nr:class B sortase [Oscillospiraceae bacterium]